MEYHKALDKLKEWTDSVGWVGQKHKEWGLEFGDGVQRTCTLSIVKYHMEPKHEQRVANAQALQMIVAGSLRFSVDRKGKFTKPQWVRHWDYSKWPGQMYVGSRDNVDPFLIALALYAPYSPYLRRIHKLMIKTIWRRGGMLWNYKHIWPKIDEEPKLPDFIYPWNIAARQIRRSGSWYFYPLLWIYDLDTVVNSIIRVIKSFTHPNHTSGDLNHIIRLAFNQMIFWTPTIWIAKMIYRLRMQPGDDKNSRADNGLPAVKNALRYYARTPMDTPMYLVLDFTIDKYL